MFPKWASVNSGLHACRQTLAEPIHIHWGSRCTKFCRAPHTVLGTVLPLHAALL